jgi:rhamnose transport system permease protein
MSTISPTAPAPDRTPNVPRTGDSPLKALLGRWETLILGLLVLVFIFGASISSEFLTGDSLTTGTSDFSEIALLALPLTLIIATGEIDLSVASILALSSSLMGYLWNEGLPMEAIIPICLVAGAACGTLNGWLVTGLGLPSLAVTIGTQALFRGLAFVILGDQSVTSFPANYTDWAFGEFAGTPIPNTIVLFLVLAAIFAIVLHRTPFGRSIFAIGANKEAARFSGLRVNRTQLQLFILSGVIAALAGVILTLRNSTAAGNVGMGFELTAIAAVVLGGVSIFGGTGTIGGVILGLVLLAGIQKALNLDPDISTYWVNIVFGILLVGSVLGPNIAARVREARRINTRGTRPPRPGRPAAPKTGPGGEGNTNA